MSLRYIDQEDYSVAIVGGASGIGLEAARFLNGQGARIAVLDRGVIVAEGTAAELKARVGGEVVELRDARGEVVREVPTDGSVEALRTAIDRLDSLGVTGATIGIRKPSLDDAFLALTGQSTANEIEKEAVR